jgi:proline dehydrogenase
VTIRRRLLFRLATSDTFEHLVRALPPVEAQARRRALRYVAGETLDDALAVARVLQEQGLSAAIDFFGEQVRDAAEAERAVAGYVALAERLPEAPATTSVALDLSHVGQDVSPAFCFRQLERIVEALPRERRLDVGAEDSERIAASHQILVAIASRGVHMQATLQANLRRSIGDWPRLVDAGLAIRLVKDAYVEPERVAHRYGAATDGAYRRLAQALRAAGARLSLATHDAPLRDALLDELGPMDVEMLLGVRPEDHADLRARSVAVRLYVPYGRDWFRYWMRRLAEAQGAG